MRQRRDRSEVAGKSTGNSSFRALSLDAVAFLVADVQGGVGPYLNVFLVTSQHWSQSAVGLVTSLGGLLALALNTPAGALIDRTRAKQAFLMAALAIMGLAAATIPLTPHFWPVMVANAGMAVVGDIVGPAIAAITLGLVARDQLARRLGRNAACFHAGNIFIAGLAGLVGWIWSQGAVFFLVPVFAVLAIVAILSIPAGAIDHRRASCTDGGSPIDQGQVSWKQILREGDLATFGVCAALFHFGNAALLPLVGQKLAVANPDYATAMMSACIIAAQVVMLPIAIAVGSNADRIGRKPIFLIAFAILPIRAFLYPLSDHSAWLIGIQLLDGVGAGVFDALTPLLLSDVMRGSGRFNLAQGLVATLQGVGASLSGLAAGLIVDHWGYSWAFSALGTVAAIAFAAFLILMPETADFPPARASRQR